MRTLRVISIIIPSFLTLTACGGGGGATPVIGPNDLNFAPNTPVNVTQSRTAAGWRQSAGGDISAEAVPVEITMLSNGNIRLRYNSGVETILTDPDGNGEYTGIEPGTDNELSLAGNTLLPVGEHVSSVAISWRENGGGAGLDVASALIGNPSSSLPSGGPALFTGDAIVFLSGSTFGSASTDGSVTLAADFDAGEVNASLSYEYDGGKLIHLGSPAAIVGHSFETTDVTESTTDFAVSNGNWSGMFFGPDAPEAGGVITYDYIDSGVGETGSVAAIYTVSQ